MHEPALNVSPLRPPSCSGSTVWHPGCKNTTRTEERHRERVGIRDLFVLDFVSTECASLFASRDGVLQEIWFI